MSGTNLPPEDYELALAAEEAPYMSVVPGRAAIDRRLTAHDYRIFALMCGYSNKITRICWPKQETLARLLGTNVQVISKCVSKLIKLGYVEVAKSGFPARNVYRVIFDDPNPKPLAECLPATELSPQTSQSCLPRQVRVVSPDKRNNRLIEQTIRTSSSEVSYLPTSLAQRAEKPAEATTATVTAPPERRTRERFDPSALRRDPLYVALCAYLPEPVLDPEWKQWAAMINWLNRAGVQPSDIPTAVKGWQLRWDMSKLTLPALVHNWSQIRDGKTGDEVAKAIRHQKRDAAEAERAAERARREPDDRAEIERIERELFGE